MKKSRHLFNKTQFLQFFLGEATRKKYVFLQSMLVKGSLYFGGLIASFALIS